MKFSVGIEYALHCLIYMIDLEEGKAIGVRDLAQFQGVSESYLSKTFTKLSKAGIITSASGIKGGYRLAKDPADINFWDVIAAIEGDAPMFRCGNILDDLMIPATNGPELHVKSPCLINEVMFAAENEMRKYLAKVTIAWLYDEVFNHKYTPAQKQKTIEWFQAHSW